MFVELVHIYHAGREIISSVELIFSSIVDLTV